jgi:hypothetical protein
VKTGGGTTTLRPAKGTAKALGALGVKVTPTGTAGGITLTGTTALMAGMKIGTAAPAGQAV